STKKPESLHRDLGLCADGGQLLQKAPEIERLFQARHSRHRRRTVRRAGHEENRQMRFKIRQALRNFQAALNPEVHIQQGDIDMVFHEPIQGLPAVAGGDDFIILAGESPTESFQHAGIVKKQRSCWLMTIQASWKLTPRVLPSTRS